MHPKYRHTKMSAATSKLMANQAGPPSPSDVGEGDDVVDVDVDVVGSEDDAGIKGTGVSGIMKMVEMPRRPIAVVDRLRKNHDSGALKSPLDRNPVA